MLFVDHELITPRPGAMIDGPILVVEGVFRDAGAVAEAVRVSVAQASLDAALERDGALVRYRAEINVSHLACRLRIVIRASVREGGEVALREAAAWRPGWRPPVRRAAPVSVEAARTGATVSGVARSDEGLTRIELRSGDRVVEVELDEGGVFEAEAVAVGPVELWAHHADPARAPTLLGVLDEDGRDLTPGADPSFAPLETFTAALEAGRRLSLLRRDGSREEAAAYRLTPAGADWGLTIRDNGGFRTEPLAGVETFGASGSPLEPLDAAGRETLKTHLQGFPEPAQTLASDDLAPFGVALPAFRLRPPPAVIDRVVLVRPGPFATDELYVLAPLAPELAARGIPLEIVSLEAEGAAEALRETRLDERTVVVVSRRAGAGWVARLAADPRPFVVYLMDDDPLAAIDAEGVPHRYRRRMIELTATDFAPLLRRCDRLMASSKRLAETFASRKTVLLEPPFIRPAPSLAHFDDLSEIRVVYHATDVHRDDFDFLVPALERLLKDRPQVRLELVSGLPPGRLAKLSNFERIKPMEWAQYKAYAAARPAHVSLAPMLATPFNAAKSVVKMLDAASLGAAGVYSRVEPYAEAIRHDVDGLLLENDPPAWRKALVALADQPKRLRRLAAAGGAAARARSLDDATAVWTRLLALG
ncbi:glycosyltransferase [Chenggangzhangella methanolivorans]|uniref:Uncharacterized protein n=1 Tax=Chenggangzhangella methanolivorans TaxID=1437009 RepID=A0A9E6RDQ7_9HYPH|nr:glycosyltransferase [Chenggangzhangella methanolivorans]QZO01464.1 hypothetical protein K6K41_08510 [Chenggangzhangella methanolivorans]